MKDIKPMKVVNDRGWPLGWNGSTARMIFSPHVAPIYFYNKETAQSARKTMAEECKISFDAIKIIELD